MNRWRVGEDRGSKEKNRCPLTASTAVDEAKSKWCCLSWVLSLQKDFMNEKPEIQHYLEGRGHVCMFYPKFHCKTDPIEMLWVCQGILLFFILIHCDMCLHSLWSHLLYTS
jgi:hypothetical protein